MNRRDVIGLALGGIALRAFAGSDFWKQKNASQWTSDEVHRLMTKSPWAQQVNAGMQAPAGPDEAMPDNGAGMGGPGGRGMGGPGGSNTTGYPIGGSSHGARPATTVTIRWESAQPILDATKETLPHALDGHYVIAVDGLPVDWGKWQHGRNRTGRADPTVRVSDIVEMLTAGATLEARGRDPVGAGVVRRSPTDEGWLFGFSKDLLPLSASDKDILFTLKAGPMAVKAKFEPKSMIYNGAFAI